MARPRSTETRERLLQAAIETLQERGFARTSSRAVAQRAGANQALVFYYFGSFEDLLLAALERVSTERLPRSEAAVEAAATPSDLVGTLRTIYAEDRASGALAVVSEVLAASVAHAELGPRVVALMQPWVDLVERSLRRLLAESPLAGAADPHQLALAAVTF